MIFTCMASKWSCVDNTIRGRWAVSADMWHMVTLIELGVDQPGRVKLGRPRDSARLDLTVFNKVSQ